MPATSSKRASAAALVLLVAAAGVVALAVGALDPGLALVLAAQLLVLCALGVLHASVRGVERAQRRLHGEMADARREARGSAEDVGAAARTAVAESVDEAAGLLLAAVGEERVERVLRHEELQGRLDDVRQGMSSSLGELAAAVGRGDDADARRHEAVRDELRALRDHASRACRQADAARRVEFRQLESLLDLHSVLRPRAPVPSSRGWAASPDVLSTLVRQVLELRPQLVVDCGSGLSTLWMAYAVEQLGAGGRVVALEHDAHYAGQTQALLASHRLLATAEVRHAPLTRLDTGADEHWLWYDPAAVDDLLGVGLVFVDGPPESVHELSRYPAVPVLLDRCTADVRLLLDDAHRDGEQRTVRRWTAEHALIARELDGHEKGCCLLSRAA